MAVVLRWFALALLAPIAALLLGMQLAALVATWGLVNLGISAVSQSEDALQRGARGLQLAAHITELTWTSPAAKALQLNPMSLGIVDEAASMATAVEVASESLTPVAQLAAIGLGFDGNPRLVSGSTVNLEMIPAVVNPTGQLTQTLRRTDIALSEVSGDGPVGRPIAGVAQQWRRVVVPLAQLTESLNLALPQLPDALGSQEPKRYLICALNDAEIFGSGGAPLAAAMVEAVNGTISIPVSGQMESKLSPNNPPIKWSYKGGPPWYQEDRQYPFVNSNFAPDFRSAAIDIRRAWAALGYPAVAGVISVDVTALSRILEWTGPVRTPGFGQITSENLNRKVLVDSYRAYDSLEGVEIRHQMNADLAASLATKVTQPTQLLNTLAGAMSSIPDRHIQANFEEPIMQAAVTKLGASGRLANEPGDLLGVFSQSGPNKLSVFQERHIDHDVILTADGGARVTQTVYFTNAVPPDLEGDPSTYRGYLALRARLRVAYRIPERASDWSLDQGGTRALVKTSRVGPYPDGAGGKVLWQGQDIAPGAFGKVVLTYRLPAGTWPRENGMPIYTLAADPQALAKPVSLRLRVSSDSGAPKPALGPGWLREGEAITWRGKLDHPMRISLVEASATQVQ